MKFVDSYYKLQDLCHCLKNGDYQAIETSAYLLSKYISKDDVVITMPSHFGHATYMLQIANLLHDKCGCKVMGILSSPYHEPWCDTKMKNGINAAMNYEFSVSNQDSTPNKIYIIDNVYSSGKTMNNAITKIKSVFQESNVDGLVIGYVDQETIKQLHYNENLHEALSPRFPSGSKYEQYCRKNISQFESLIVSFLKNTEEGEKLYDIHYFDNNGQSSDEDMEYQINHLGLESIINKLIL